MSELMESDILKWLNEEIVSHEKQLDSAKNFGWEYKAASIEYELKRLKATHRLIEQGKREITTQRLLDFAFYNAGESDASKIYQSIFDLFKNLGFEIIEAGK